MIRAARPRTLNPPLLDPLKYLFRVRRRHVPAHAALLIWVSGFTERAPLPPPPSPDNPIDAARLALRLEALASALDDLPGQAKRFARWKARRDAAVAQRKEGCVAAGAHDKTRGPVRFQRIWPRKTGRPPGWRRKPTHEVHEVLDALHGLAFWALEKPDTS